MSISGVKRIVREIAGIAFTVGFAWLALGDATTAPSTQPRYLFEISITSSKIDQVPLRPRDPAKGAGAQETFSAGKMLILHVQIKNNWTGPVVYHTFAGDGSKQERYASLVNAKREYYTLADFGDMEPIGATREATIAAGESVLDVICFTPPEKDCGRLSLFLPWKSLGHIGQHVIMFDINGDGELLTAGK